QFRAKAPDSDGIFNFDWQMVEERVQWFGQACSAKIAVSRSPAVLENPRPGELDRSMSRHAEVATESPGSAEQTTRLENSVTIIEKAGTASVNYPIQIGRPFVQGEIRNFPQAIVGNAPTLTQADVKSRWPDGSVKHAILSFLIPRLEARGRLKITFRNQP